MGLPLYMNYYSVHDDVNGRIGFAPHKTSTKSPLQRGDQPSTIFASSKPYESDSSYVAWFIVIALIIGFGVLWIVLLSDFVRRVG